MPLELWQPVIHRLNKSPGSEFASLANEGREVGRQRFGLTDLILCETLRGMADGRLFEQVLSSLHNFELFETGGRELAIAAARNYRCLRKKGFTIKKTIDCWIATF